MILVASLLVGLAAAVLLGPSSNPLSRLRPRTRRLEHVRTHMLRHSLLRARRNRTKRADRADAVAEACVIMAAELSAGRPPPLALRTAAAEWPDLFTVPAGRAQVGGGVAPALRQAATQPGAESLAAAGAAWEVSERTGAKLSDTLLSVADTLRDEAAIRREVRAHLATVRVTARLMAVLPIGTLGVFSAGSGGRPLLFLLTTPHGLGCLASAAVLVSLGLLWVERTARRATRSAWLT